MNAHHGGYAGGEYNRMARQEYARELSGEKAGIDVRSDFNRERQEPL
jgi:hypothetical protein